MTSMQNPNITFYAKVHSKAINNSICLRKFHDLNQFIVEKREKSKNQKFVAKIFMIHKRAMLDKEKKR